MNADTLPDSAQTVIVGGGAVGASIAYHLAKAGHRDIVLLERGAFTCGTTWHAAGLIGQLRAGLTMCRLCQYAPALFPELIEESGQDIGFRQTGSIVLARHHERLHEIARTVSTGKLVGIEAQMITPAEAKRLYPLLDEATVVGGAYIPDDGQVNPVDLTMAYIKAARAAGARCIEQVTVEDCIVDEPRQVVTDRGNIRCENIVLACGLWTRDIALKLGVAVPLYAAEHMYIVTEPMSLGDEGLPSVRDPDGHNYIKEDAGKLLVGAFEPRGEALAVADLPAEQQFIQLPENWERFELPMSRACELLPSLTQAGIGYFFNGPESFTPDNRFIVGEAPGLRRVFIAAGFNSQGIVSSAAIGREIANLIVEGEYSLDLSEIDIRRFVGYENNESFLRDRTRETLGLLYGMHWPNRQFETARNIRKVPLYDELHARGACFGTVAGWERAHWFAPSGVEPVHEYSWQKQNWFDITRGEHLNVRENVGIFDLSPFGKTMIQGDGVARLLDGILPSDMDVPVGKICYTLALTPSGGIYSDFTVTRVSEDQYMLISAAANQRRDSLWFREHLPDSIHISDITCAFGVLAVMGPQSRALLQRVVDADLTNAAFPFGTARYIDIGHTRVWAQRITFVGELGWELYASVETMGYLFDLLMSAGAQVNVALAGYYAMDSLRSEKGYRHWGHDIDTHTSPLQARLDFCLSKKKDDYIGAAGIARRREQGFSEYQVYVKLAEPDILFFHDEPIGYRDNIVGHTTSGAYGYSLGAAVGLGYIDLQKIGANDIGDVVGDDYYVEVAGVRHRATVGIKPFYDPTNQRIKG